ncbi:MAG: EamA family transporter [Coriobacteriia bacterium]|nr:EamA family transporter [Coriobacteriia bacterium]
MPRLSFRAKTIIAFATVYVVWGSTYLAIKVGLNEALPPSLFGGLRLVPAGLILLAFAKVRGTSLAISRRDLSTAAVVGLCLLCGGMYSTMIAEGFISSSLTALVVAVAPLWMALAEAVLPGMDRPTGRGILGLVLGLAGLALLVGPRLAGVSGTLTDVIGMSIQVVGTWLWVGGSIVSKKRPLTTDGTVATGYEMLIAGGVLLLVGLVRGEHVGLSISPAAFGALAYLSVFGSAVAFTAFMWLIRNIAASKVMTYAYVNPVVAVLLGYLAGVVGLLAEPERLDVWGVAGMAVIVGGVALATSAPVKRAERDPVGPDAAGLPEIPSP